MARSSRQAEFDREFRRHIERFTPAAEEALRKIITTKTPREVKVLVFEMQPDWRSFPVHVFAMDDETPDEVYFEEPFNGFLLPDAGPLIPKGAID